MDKCDPFYIRVINRIFCFWQNWFWRDLFLIFWNWFWRERGGTPVICISISLYIGLIFSYFSDVIDVIDDVIGLLLSYFSDVSDVLSTLPCASPRASILSFLIFQSKMKPLDVAALDKALQNELSWPAAILCPNADGSGEYNLLRQTPQPFCPQIFTTLSSSPTHTVWLDWITIWNKPQDN